jgi:hypothetical protein
MILLAVPGEFWQRLSHDGKGKAFHLVADYLATCLLLVCP